MSDYRIDDMTPQPFIQVVGTAPGAALVPCPANLDVTWSQCHDRFMNVVCYKRKDDPCWGCPVGEERRKVLAHDITGNRFHTELRLPPELPKRSSMVRSRRT